MSALHRFGFASPRAVPLLAALLAVVALAGCAEDSPAGQRAELLAAVPQSALERGLFLWSGAPGEGFGSALPDGALRAVLGIEPEQVEAVAESGGAPFTVLLGDLNAEEMAEAATAAGYDHAEVAGWRLLRRSGEPQDALQAAVTAVAVRDGLAILGSPDEVSALVDGAPTASGVRWVTVASEAAEGSLLALGRPLPTLLAAAGDASALLQRTQARGDLPEWDGWAAAVADGGEGELLLVLPAGAADAEAAGELALRAATGPVLSGGRLIADVLEGGAPGFEQGTGLLRLPVTWQISPAELRSDVEAGAYTFLVPGT